MNNVIDAHVLKRNAADVRNDIAQFFFRVVLAEDSVSLLDVSDTCNDLYATTIVTIEFQNPPDQRLPYQTRCSGYKECLSVKTVQIHLYHS